MMFGYGKSFLNIYVIFACILVFESDQKLCPKQPLSFGPNCSLPCHCLDGVCDARTEGEGCKSGQCSPGYTGFPLCQLRCPSGYYGVNCSSGCMCYPQNLCNPVNGNCLNGNKCKLTRFGSGCQGVRSSMLLPPSVSTTCRSFILSWPSYNNLTYIGSSDIVSYKVFMDGYVTDTIVVPNGTLSEIVQEFVPPDISRFHTFQIRPDFNVSLTPGYYVETGVLGPPSVALAVECPAPVNFTVSVLSNNLIATWRKPTTPAIERTQILLQLMRIGDCFVPNITYPLVANHTTTDLYFSHELDHWRTYAIEAYGLTASGVQTNRIRKTVTTLEGVPVGPPTNLHLVYETTSSSATVHWSPPPCNHRMGQKKRYAVTLYPSNNSIQLNSNSPTNEPPMKIAGLQPRHSYRFSVSYVNVAGVGPTADITFTTKSTGSPTAFHVLSRTSDSITVIWTAPLNDHGRGELSGFMVEYWSLDQPSARQSSQLLPSNTTQFQLTKLGKQTAYACQVFSLFGSDRIGSTVITVETTVALPSNASLDLRLIRRSSNQIEVAWLIDPGSASTFPSFMLAMSLRQSMLPSEPHFATRQYRYDATRNKAHVFDQLPAASKFTISMYAIFSSTSESNSPHAIMDVWTAPSPFDSRSVLPYTEFSVASRTISKVSVRFPLISGYDGGPLNQYYIAVHQQANASIDPANMSTVADVTNSLPLGTRIVYFSNKPPKEVIEIGSGAVFHDALPSDPHIASYKYENPPLESNITYVAYALIGSKVDDTFQSMIVGKLNFCTADGIRHASGILDDDGYADGAFAWRLVVGIFVLLLFCVGCFVVYRLCCPPSRRFKTYDLKKKNDTVNVWLKEKISDDQLRLLPDSYAWWSIPLDARAPRYLIIDPEHGPRSTLVGTWSKADLVETFIREFTSIPTGCRYPYGVSKQRLNLNKNRVTSALPYDHNRVRLKRPPASSETDYINASLVDGYMRRKAYIAAQSPFDTPTACDFWLMVFQHNVSQIVMLTNLVEDSTLKCCKYWPEVRPRSDLNLDCSSGNGVEPTQRFEDIEVRAVDRVSYAHFTVRHFTLTELTTGTAHYVTQYHFHSWVTPELQPIVVPHKNGHISMDFGFKPNQSCVAPFEEKFVNSFELFSGSSPFGSEFDRLAFLEFYYRVKTASRPEDGPILVHCATGLVRTGLFIALDSLLQQATHERMVSVARFCSSLSKARANMFCSTRQYVLLYDLLYDALLAGHCIVDLDVSSTLRILSHQNVRIGRTYLWEQWALLHLYTPSPDPDKDLVEALSAINLSRNRFSKDYDLLPSARWRPKFQHLSVHIHDGFLPSYINAVYFDGSALRDDVIVTQTPLTQTVDDFWLLIEDEKISCIVDMEPFCYGEKDAVRYWPLRPAESSSRPLFDGTIDDERLECDAMFEKGDPEPSRGPWISLAGGKLKICQLGSLTPVKLDPVSRKRGSNYGIYRRRLLIRFSENDQASSVLGRKLSPERVKAREIVVFHFAGSWNVSCQIPESRASIVRLLEAVRLERGAGPLLVHCLDGATRSGLLVACHLLAERLTRDHYVDLFHVVKAIKLRRRAIIASPEQLRFVYRVLIHWIKKTLAEPLSAWTAKHLGAEVNPKLRWPQLVAHLPPYERVGIFSHSQLPALAIDHTVGLNTDGMDNVAVNMHNVSNSTSSLRTTDTGRAPIGLRKNTNLYFYFGDELVHQRSTLSLRKNRFGRVDEAGDGHEICSSWSSNRLDLI